MTPAEGQSTTTTETATTPDAAQTTETTPQSSPTGETETTPVDPQTGKPAAPAWQPNFKYKAGGEDKEIPEWLRSSVKNKEHEKEIRELHEKVHGFDKLKGTSTKLESQIQQVMPEYNSLKTTVSKVVQYRDSGDLNSFFEATGVKKEQVANWMLKELQLQELTAEQRQVYDNEQALRKQNYALTDQVASLRQTATQGQLQAQALTLQTALAKPEVKAVSDSFNVRMATPDAFWNFVCQQADFMEKSGGKPVSADEAVQEAMRLLGPAAAGQAQPNLTHGNGNGSPTPPVIPNVSSRNSSPTKKVARSTDDLRKIYQDMAQD